MGLPDTEQRGPLDADQQTGLAGWMCLPQASTVQGQSTSHNGWRGGWLSQSETSDFDPLVPHTN